MCQWPLTYGNHLSLSGGRWGWTENSSFCYTFLHYCWAKCCYAFGDKCKKKNYTQPVTFLVFCAAPSLQSISSSHSQKPPTATAKQALVVSWGQLLSNVCITSHKKSQYIQYRCGFWVWKISQWMPWMAFNSPCSGRVGAASLHLIVWSAPCYLHLLYTLTGKGS